MVGIVLVALGLAIGLFGLVVLLANVDLKDASFNKLDIFAHAPKSSAALAYQKLIEEVFSA